MHLYKVLTKDFIHNDFTFKEGLNVDHIPFNPEFNTPGGICYSGPGILLELGKGYWISEVRVPEDAQTAKQNYGVSKLPDFWKSDKVILGKPREISVDLIKEIVATGEVYLDEIMVSFPIIGGHYEVAEYMISELGMKPQRYMQKLLDDRLPVPYPCRGRNMNRI